ncbi:MAG: TonB-dependent receptor [Bacteroidetes bacterium]|nr:TonB-dependent receptor [Bacteroidota bacterium]
MARFKYVVILFMVALMQLSKAQSISLSGYVTDEVSKKPLQNVNIKVKNTNYVTVTNNIGFFKVHYQDVANPVLIFSHVGYKNEEIQLSETNGEKLLEIVMKASVLNLTEIEIMGLTDNQIPFSIDKIVLKNIEATNLSDIGGLIATQPNIGGIRKGATGIDPVIRGFKYSQVVVQLNGGTRIEGGCPNRMDPTASHVNINDLNEITIYKGPFALKYGPNFGGLINLKTHTPHFYNKFEKHISMFVGGQTNHNGYKSGIRIFGGNSLLSYTVSANRNKFGDYTAGNGDIINSSSDNYNITSGIGIRPAEGHVTTINYDRSWGRNVDFTALPMDERTDDTKIYEFSYLVTSIGDAINFIKIVAYHSDVNHEMDNKNRPFSDTVVAISRIHAMNTGGRFAANINLLQGRIELGGNFERIFKNGNREKWLIMQPALPHFSESIWNNAIINNLGLFAEYQHSCNNFDWIISARTDLNSAASDPMLRYKPTGDPVYKNADTKSEYINFSFSAGVTWYISTESEISLSFGKGTRSPDMIERYIILLPVGYDPYDYLGNPQLKPETNHEVDLGYKFMDHKFGTISTSIFFSYVTDYISTVRVPPSQVMPQTKGVLGVKSFTNISNAYLTGYELTYNTPESNKWQVKFNSAYTMGINPLATKYIVENGAVTDETTIKNDPLPEIQPLEANLWFSYKFFNQKIVPELNVRMIADQTRISESYNEESTPGNTIFNFKVKYAYSDQLQIIFGINNILNLNYYEHLNRRIIGSRMPFLEPGRLFYTNLIINL